MYRIYLFFLIIAFPSLLHSRTEIINFNRKNIKQLKLINTHLTQNTIGKQSIQLQTSNYYNSNSNLLYLDFEQSRPNLLRDISGNYRIKNSNYIVDSTGLFGRRSALFNRKENNISILSPENLWPGNNTIDDFSIEFWIKPVFYYRHNSILKKYNMINGFKHGIEIYIKDKKIYFSAYNLFKNGKDENLSLHLNSINNIERNKWSKINISYQASSGKIILLVNGIEESSVQAKDDNSIWTGSMNPLDRSLIQIGSSYSGYLDEFRISRSVFNNHTRQNFNMSLYPTLKVHVPSLRSKQKHGIVVSNVHNPSPNKNISDFSIKFNTTEPNDSNINIFVRESIRSFNSNVSDKILPWKIVKNNSISFFNQIGFYQWKAVLKANPAGTSTPSLDSIQISYNENEVMPTPGDFKIIKSGSSQNKIILEWNEVSSVETSKNSGYNFYIGLQPDEFSGSLYIQKTSDHIKKSKNTTYPLTKEEKINKEKYPELFFKQHENKLRITISNQMIIDHTSNTNRRFPLIMQNRVYYFAISSVTKNSHEIESKISQAKSIYIKPVN